MSKNTLRFIRMQERFTAGYRFWEKRHVVRLLQVFLFFLSVLYVEIIC